MSELRDLVFENVDLKSLVEDLQFDADDVEQAALKQPKLYLEASRYRVQRLHRRQNALRAFELLKAQQATLLRRENSTTTAAKRMGVAEIADRVTKLAVVCEARAKMEQEIELEEFTRSLMEAYRQRFSVLKIVSEIRNSEINSEVRAVRIREAVDDTDKIRDKARKRVRQLTGGD